MLIRNSGCSAKCTDQAKTRGIAIRYMHLPLSNRLTSTDWYAIIFKENAVFSMSLFLILTLSAACQRKLQFPKNKTLMYEHALQM